jgi:ribosomal protein L23
MLNNTYVFNISGSATKIDVKKSVKELYWVDVASVNIVNVREKFKHSRKRWMQIKRSTVKKAYITLKDAKAKIDFSIIK